MHADNADYIIRGHKLTVIPPVSRLKFTWIFPHESLLSSVEGIARQSISLLSTGGPLDS